MSRRTKEEDSDIKTSSLETRLLYDCLPWAPSHVGPMSDPDDKTSTTVPFWWVNHVQEKVCDGLPSQYKKY